MIHQGFRNKRDEQVLAYGLFVNHFAIPEDLVTGHITRRSIPIETHPVDAGRDGERRDYGWWLQLDRHRPRRRRFSTMATDQDRNNDICVSCSGKY